MKYCSLVIAATLALNDIASGYGVQGKNPPPDMNGNEVGDHHQTPHSDGSATTLVGKGFRESRKGLTPLMSSSSSLPTAKFPANGTNSVSHWNGIFDDRNHGDSTSKNDLIAHGKAEQDGSEGPVHDSTSVQRSLKDEGLSSWDGWKNIKPSNSHLTCIDGDSGLLRPCSEYSNSNDDKILFMHDEKGRIVHKKSDESDCLTVILDGDDDGYVSGFSTCSDTDEAQVWTRTANGQFKNKLHNTKVLARADCDADLVTEFTGIAINDESYVPAGCDLFAVVGPHDHDPLDFGSVLFHQIGDDLAPVDGNEDESFDESFGSSVSIDNNGDFVVVGGSFDSGDDKFTATVTIYEKTGNVLGDFSWTKKLDYEMMGFESAYKPKVTVTISGNANKVALAVASANDNGAIQVLDYDKIAGTLSPIGSEFIEGDSTGELPGLKLSMDETGDTLVVGSPFYDHEDIENAGRVRIYNYSSNANSYSLTKDEFGNAQDDFMGSAVSISKNGDLIGYGHAGQDSFGLNKGAAGVLKLVNGVWENFATQIPGEENNDEAGFSVKVVRVLDEIVLAFGAIFNDGNNQVNSGHVRVYKCAYTNCDAWEKVGSDIDGDNGVVIDGFSFHVGDAFGFSLDMSADGKRLLIGAPFHSASRASDYYSGSVKLFELSSDTNDWEQLGHDLIGDTTSETSGYSVGMSRNGKTLVVGSPGTDRGTVQVYLQDEVSNAPSDVPSLAPSSEPSSTPSDVPSFEPTTTSEPSATPSLEPSLSSAPSDVPTTTSEPSATPSLEPSSEPSSIPTRVPSSVPSSKPTTTSQPSNEPSQTNVPSVSIAPSDQPSISSAPSVSMEPSNAPSISEKPSVSSSPSAAPSISQAPSVSSRPSSQPSLSSEPSSEPSNVPSSKPTTTSPPSLVPTSEPSSEPSFVPTRMPSSDPSSEPSSLPSTVPSSEPSVSSEPSSVPSSLPSSEPSVSSRPSLLPSSTPSLSQEPSLAPSTKINRAFQIRSFYSRFDKVVETDEAWCVQASSATPGGPGGKLNMRPCDVGVDNQIWMLNENNRIVLKESPNMAIDFEGRIVQLMGVTMAKEQKFVINYDEGSISVTNANDKELYLGIDASKIFSRLRLFKGGDDNESLYAWHIQYLGPSYEPSVSHVSFLMFWNFI